MNWRRSYLVLLAVATVAIVFACVIVIWPDPAAAGGAAVDKRNYELIREGMTFSEVEAILGAPRRQQSLSGRPVVAFFGEAGSSNSCVIAFDSYGLAMGKTSEYFDDETLPPISDGIRWKIKQQWRRWCQK
jgi:hypothetical protein